MLSPSGAKVGEVREIVADGNGQVRQLMVANGDARELIPAGNFTAAGDALVMSSGEASSNTNGGNDEPTEESVEGSAE